MAPFMASINKRELKSCGSFTVGCYGEKKKTSRVVRVMCYYLDGTTNMYMRPIEGITVTADLDLMKIMGYYGRLEVAVPNAKGTDHNRSHHLVQIKENHSIALRTKFHHRWKHNVT